MVTSRLWFVLLYINTFLSQYNGTFTTKDQTHEYWTILDWSQLVKENKDDIKTCPLKKKKKERKKKADQTRSSPHFGSLRQCSPPCAFLWNSTPIEGHRQVLFYAHLCIPTLPAALIKTFLGFSRLRRRLFCCVLEHLVNPVIFYDNWKKK